MAAPEVVLVPSRYTNHLPFPKQLQEDPDPHGFLIWRDTPLQVPVSLDVIEDGSHLSVVKMWRQRDHKPIVRLQHPKLMNATADYWICWVTWITKGSNQSAFVILQLPPDWPGETSKQLVVVRFAGGELITLSDAEFRQVLSQVEEDQFRTFNQDEPEQLFGVDRESPELIDYIDYKDEKLCRRCSTDLAHEQIVNDYHRYDKHQQAVRGQYQNVCCASCRCPVEDRTAEVCTKCGVGRTAPACSQCGNFVSHNRDFYTDRSDFPWNHGWDGKCVSCGYSYEKELVVAGGHGVIFDQLHSGSLTEIVLEAGGTDRGEVMANAMQLAELGVGDNHELLSGRTKIRIELGESLLHWYENADTESTIVVTFDRRQACSKDESLGGLLKSVSIALTAEEWRALSDQLNGPLKVLLERKPYHADLT